MKIIIAIIIAAVIFIVSVSQADSLCVESTRLKNTDHERWVKAGVGDCKVYDNILIHE